MAFTKVRGRGVTTTDNYTVGVITATKFVGPITGGGGGIQVGLLTATGLDINGDADISGNLTVGGDFTTLNTTLREVELLHVDANSSATAGIITQRGSGDILNLFDNNTEVLTVIDGGRVGIGKTNPDTNSILHIKKASVNQVKIETTNSNSYGVLRFAESDHDGTKDKYLIAYGDDTGATANGFALKNQIGHIGFFAGGVAATDERLRVGSTGKVSIGDVATHTYSAHSEGDDLVIGGAGWRGMTIYGEGGGGVIQFADDADNRVGQILYVHSSNEMKFRTSGNQDRLEIGSGGDLTITNGDLVVADGHGINFAATSDGSGTTNSELLDDYEEGTFTMTVNLINESYVAQTFYYTKIGRLVTWSGRLQWSGASGTSDQILGLPFTVKNQDYTNTMTTNIYSNAGLDVGDADYLCAYHAQGNSRLHMTKQTTTEQYNLPGSANIYMTGFYYTDS